LKRKKYLPKPNNGKKGDSMFFPRLQETEKRRDMTTVFGGYNHQISCQEGQFFDMKNMTSKYFPVLSPRQNRGIIKALTNPQGLVDKEGIWWIDDNVLYENGDWRLNKNLDILPSDKLPLEGDEQRTLVKMGAYIVIMPDKLWVKVKEDSIIPDWGYMENTFEVTSGSRINFSICEASGKVIEHHDAEYYKKNEPKDGDYMMTTTTDGKPSLKVYSGTTSIWMTVASAYLQITREGIGKGFEKEDGVKITTDHRSEFENIFVNVEDDNIHYSVNTYIVDRTDDSITIPGIYSGKFAFFDNMYLKVERKVPDMAFITECNNRLWGCSKDGHEIYCCKLGDVKNWNCFRGVSTDSWAATVGSDGKFTGAITFLGYPIFFKEDSLIKISVSSTGGHAIKETKCRGVQKGSGKSLSILNETLYYKSPTCVCGYNGSLPYSISDELGDARYYDAVAGSVGDRYYISMRDSNDVYNFFVYDAKNGIWCKEDNTEVLDFCRHSDDLFYIDAKDKTVKSVRGTLHFVEGEKITDANPVTEGKFDWYVESGPIGYSSPDNKYVGRINLRITLEFGTNVDFFLQYDSNGEWEHKFNMSGQGTRTYSVPVIPKRCDHFRYKIVGKGGCKIHSVTKTIEGGSDD
jgi:hypothetical protein